MTPQSGFMILASIAGPREAELRALLESMNQAPGQVHAENPLVPFTRFRQVHFARFVILDDPTLADAVAGGGPRPGYPLYLAFLGDIDGDEASFLDELVSVAGPGLRTIFACCEDFPPEADLRDWLQRHRTRAVASYVNCRGRTVQQVREEQMLRDAVVRHITDNKIAFAGLAPRAVHARLRKFVKAEIAVGRLTLSHPEPTPFGWAVRNLLHLVGLPLGLLILSPLWIWTVPIVAWRLRQLEKTDPDPLIRVDRQYAQTLAAGEDHDVTNQFSAIGTVKPGWVRQVTAVGVHLVIDYAARHIARPGRLGRIRSIHFARWVFLDNRRRLAFFSNYDGSVAAYMDDFINKTGFGLNMSFSNGVGYPRTNWLLFAGCADERKFVEFERRRTLPTQVWYKAYPGLTAVDLERNTLLRHGLDAADLDDDQAREWVALL
ncbi:MAG: hypothetical protein JSS02_21180 [Planctomycetes bacterium]|nr:hypothetical protein [Planctomycetota bacterium]